LVTVHKHVAKVQVCHFLLQEGVGGPVILEVDDHAVALSVKAAHLVKIWVIKAVLRKVHGGAILNDHLDERS
jgi:hypothetical protein